MTCTAHPVFFGW